MHTGSLPLDCGEVFSLCTDKKKPVFHSYQPSLNHNISVRNKFKYHYSSHLEPPWM
jgi:hypothetical protein